MFVISDRWHRRDSGGVIVRAQRRRSMPASGSGLAQQAPAGFRAAGTGRVAPRAIGAGGACPRLPQPSPAHPRSGCHGDWRALDGDPPPGQPVPVVANAPFIELTAGRRPLSRCGLPVAAYPTVMRGSALTVRRKASDLLVAVALVHGADHLAGGYVQHDARVGGVVAAVVSGLPTRHPGQRRQNLRRVRIGAAARQFPPRVYRTTYTGRSGTTMTYQATYPARSIRAAIRSSAIAAAFTSPWFTETGTMTRGARARDVHRTIR